MAYADQSRMTDKRRPQIVQLFALCAILALWSRAVETSSRISPVARSYVSSGKTIHVDRFAPAANGRHPRVVVLYGASGLTGDEEFLGDYAASLAEHGYVVMLVHYFDATGSATAGKLPVSQENFRFWTKATEDGVTYLSRDPDVNRRRIGIVGFSLGAFLAIWEGSQDERVKAVSEYSGGISLFLGPPKRMPPTLILHGEKDSFVPVGEAKKLQQLLQQQHTPYDIKIYPGQGHGFAGPKSDPSVRQDAFNRTLEFFREYLGR